MEFRAHSLSEAKPTAAAFWPRTALGYRRRWWARSAGLIAHPDSGSKPQELRGWRYRQIVEPRCRIFYRHDRDRVYVLYVIRGERKLRKAALSERDPRK